MPSRARELSLQIASIEQYAVRAFASALDAIPLALAENSGLNPIETLADVKSRQAVEGNARLGVDCVDAGENGACWVLRAVECVRRFRGECCRLRPESSSCAQT